MAVNLQHAFFRSIMNLFDRLLLNAASILTAKVLEGLLQLAVLAFVLARIEKELYAAALLIISIQATVELARAGMQKATLKYIAEHKAKGDVAASNTALSSSSAMQGGIGILALVACLLIAPFGTTLFSLPETLQRESQWAIILMGLGIAGIFAISPWHNSVAALERYDLISLAQVSGRLIRACLIVLLLISGVPGLLSLVFANIAGNLFERLLCIAFVKRISRDLRFSFKEVKASCVKQMLGFSLFDFFHTLSGLLYSVGSLYLAAHLVSLDAVAGLGIIANITALTGVMMNQFAQMLVPVASRLNALGQTEKLRAIIIHGTTITVFAGGAVVVGLVPWIEPLFKIWLGQGYAHLTYPAIVLIMASFLINSLTCIHNPLGGIGKVAVDGISNTICTLIGLLAAALLVSILHMGLMGIAMGMFFARLTRFVFILIYGSRVFNLNILLLCWRGYSKSFLLVIGFFVIGIQITFQPQTWFTLVASMGLTAMAYLGIGVLWVVDQSDRIRFRLAIAGGMNRLNVQLNGERNG